MKVTAQNNNATKLFRRRFIFIYSNEPISGTGPGASLGIPYKNAFSVMPKTLGGEPVHYIILDDHTDTTLAVKQARPDADQRERTLAQIREVEAFYGIQQQCLQSLLQADGLIDG